MTTEIDLPSPHETPWYPKLNTAILAIRDAADGALESAVASALINDDGHLILTLGNGSSIDAGHLAASGNAAPTSGSDQPDASTSGNIYLQIGS